MSDKPDFDPAEIVSKAIEEAIANGYDVEVKVTPTRDGRPGVIKLPMPWEVFPSRAAVLAAVETTEPN